MKPALIVFAKAPQPGQVKTRLTALLSEEEAAQLYEAFLVDALGQYEHVARTHDATLRLYHAGHHWPRRLTPGGVSVHRQRGQGLGGRMAAAFRETFAEGAHGALILGTDYPTLPPSFIGQGLKALRSVPGAICIGPSMDGGYYLLGMRRLHERLFKDMAYSHEGVFNETLIRAADAGAEPVVLPEWYDVDRPADLRRLAADISGREPFQAPRTRRRISDLAEKYPFLQTTLGRRGK